MASPHFYDLPQDTSPSTIRFLTASLGLLLLAFLIPCTNLSVIEVDLWIWINILLRSSTFHFLSSKLIIISRFVGMIVIILNLLLKKKTTSKFIYQFFMFIDKALWYWTLGVRDWFQMILLEFFLQLQY